MDFDSFRECMELEILLGSLVYEQKDLEYYVQTILLERLQAENSKVIEENNLFDINFSVLANYILQYMRFVDYSCRPVCERSGENVTFIRGDKLAFSLPTRVFRENSKNIILDKEVLYNIENNISIQGEDIRRDKLAKQIKKCFYRAIEENYNNSRQTADTELYY